MSAPVRRLWQSMAQGPIIGRLVRQPPPRQRVEEAGEIGFRLPSLEEGEPSAEHIAMLERDCAERFKRDQLLPIMGIAGTPS